MTTRPNMEQLEQEVLELLRPLDHPGRSGGPALAGGGAAAHPWLYDRTVTDVRHHCVAVGRTQRRRADRGPASRKLTNCDGLGIYNTI